MPTIDPGAPHPKREETTPCVGPRRTPYPCLDHGSQGPKPGDTFIKPGDTFIHYADITALRGIVREIVREEISQSVREEIAGSRAVRYLIDSTVNNRLATIAAIGDELAERLTALELDLGPARDRARNLAVVREHLYPPKPEETT